METNIKNYIANATFLLLKSNNINDISVTKIVALAGVSRSSFYNNFNNINEIIDYKLKNISNKIYELYVINNKRNKDLNNLLMLIINYIDKNKSFFNIIKNNFFFYFKTILDNTFLENNINKKNYIIKSGILINIILYWLETNELINN